MVAVNAVGDIWDRHTGKVIVAGARSATPGGDGLAHAMDRLLEGHAMHNSAGGGEHDARCGGDERGIDERRSHEACRADGAGWLCASDQSGTHPRGWRYDFRAFDGNA